MEQLELDDIQKIVSVGYDNLPSAKFLLLKITDAASAKKYLQHVSTQICSAANKEFETQAVHIAFTHSGLKALGLPEKSLRSFSREFTEGMHDADRAVILGDEEENDPQHWTWGAEKDDSLHILLMLYAKDNAGLNILYAEQTTVQYFMQGISILHEKETLSREDKKEHFGFADGISSPAIEGLSSDKKIARHHEAPIKPGEFVLGYRNEYNRYTEVPTVEKGSDPHNLLPQNDSDPSLKDLGKNGSYLVFREIDQFVYNFWNYMATNSKEPASGLTDAAIRLATKMVGRWPSGDPLVLSPTQDEGGKNRKEPFTYAESDAYGHKCPFGAHIRRTNPRDQLLDQKAGNQLKDRSRISNIEMIRKHQLLRRGRSFGPALVESMMPEEIMKLTGDNGKKRGLYFICLNSDIARQFEFVQSLWIKSPKFAGLYNDEDPVTGPGKNPNNEFTCPAEPVRRKYKNIPAFTKVSGGAYFFLPGIKALKFIANV